MLGTSGRLLGVSICSVFQRTITMGPLSRVRTGAPGSRTRTRCTSLHRQIFKFTASVIPACVMPHLIISTLQFTAFVLYYVELKVINGLCGVQHLLLSDYILFFTDIRYAPVRHLFTYLSNWEKVKLDIGCSVIDLYLDIKIRNRSTFSFTQSRPNFRQLCNDYINRL